MFRYQILETPSFQFEKNVIDKIFNIISKEVSKTQKWTLNIVFLEPNSIKKLNNDYRWKNYETDVLSFHYHDDFSGLSDDEIAGEIVLCEAKIISQAEEYSWWNDKEFYKLLIHSILHILWYDHINDNDYKIMQELENQIWAEVFEV